MRSLVVLIVLSCIVLMATPASYAAILYQTGFEDFTVGDINGQDGWVVTAGLGEVTDEAVDVLDGVKTLKILYGDGTNAEVRKTFSGAAMVTFECDTRVRQNNKSCKFKLRDDTNHTGPQVGFHSGGNISAWDGSTRVDLMLYNNTFEYVTVYETDFEDFTIGDVNGQEGWNIVTGIGEITDDSRYLIGGTKSLIVYRGDDPCDGDVIKTFGTGLYGSATFVKAEFNALAVVSNKSCKFKLRDALNHTGPQVGFSDNGQISAWDGNLTKVDLMAYDPNEPYAFRIEANTEDQNYDFYVDDVLIADDYAFYNTTDKNLVELRITRATTSKLSVDDLKIDIAGYRQTYNFRIEADAGTKTYDFYVDDVIKATGFAFYNTTGPLLSELRMERPTTSRMIVDNLVISAELECGDWGYPSSDINEDCYVNIKDFAIIAGAWLDCTHPDDSSCFE